MQQQPQQHSAPIDPALTGVMLFLVNEIVEARARGVSPADMHLLEYLLRRAERNSRRLKRVADALTRLDQSNPAPGNP